MIDFTNAKLKDIIVHKIGNKNNDEEIRFSEDKLIIQGDFIKELLMKFFLSSFSNKKLYRFFHDTKLELNETYYFVSEVFEKNEDFVSQSKNIAKHLYENSNHPKIKEGEFYMVLIQDCVIDDEIFDAIGLFKTETKETYLNIEENENNLEITYNTGININKIDKGCLIFNTEKDNGFIISAIDSINKSKGATFWLGDFMKIKPREDNYFFTENYLNMCKTFVDNESDEIDKNEQIEIKNNTIKYFQEKENFDIEEFKEEVIKNPETKETFKEYKQYYEEENEIEMNEDFQISENAVKKEKRKFKSVIKLDKNFHIYVHGKQEFIKKG